MANAGGLGDQYTSGRQSSTWLAIQLCCSAVGAEHVPRCRDCPGSPESRGAEEGAAVTLCTAAFTASCCTPWPPRISASSGLMAASHAIVCAASTQSSLSQILGLLPSVLACFHVTRDRSADLPGIMAHIGTGVAPWPPGARGGEAALSGWLTMEQR